MDRRKFIQTSGLAAAAFAINPRLGLSRQRSEAASMLESEVLSGIDARIEKCRKGDVTIRLAGPNGAAIAPGTAVQIEQTRHKFLFGCNIFRLKMCRTPQQNAAYEERFAALLNYATLPFYWWNYEQEKDRPADARSDEIVQWCKAHGVTTKGHPLAWNYAEPKWLPDDSEGVMKAQLERIGRCAKRFKGSIDIWDVVNEATHYDRPECEQRAPKLTQAIRKMGVGAYVREAFKAARQASDRASLVINDYRTDSAYADNVISELVGDDKRPLYDVIGIQSHMHGGYWGAGRTWAVCERFAGFGKPLHFTETTVVSGPRADKDWLTTPEGEKQQAQHVAEFYSVLFSHPAVHAITWWDFSDQGAWQRAPAGLVRGDMTPKPVYEELHKLIKDKWWTRTEATTVSGGTAAFRGFLGEYRVTVQAGNSRLTGTFRLDAVGKNIVDVRLIG